VSAPARPAAEYLAPGAAVDSDHPAVGEFAREHGCGADSREQAVALYYAVRDGFRYDPYRIDPGLPGFQASTVIARGHGFCVSKAALLAAASRVVGIPARLGFADVRNHLTSARLREMMGTDEFLYHGYTELWLGERWVKATPAFNLTLCEKAGIHPLEFDGESDSVFHPLDTSGQRHMEYLRDHGSFADAPVEQILGVWRDVYPAWLQGAAVTLEGDFEQEATAPSSAPL
jgi:transglutaminase-like putative cysteine protease